MIGLSGKSYESLFERRIEGSKPFYAQLAEWLRGATRDADVLYVQREKVYLVHDSTSCVLLSCVQLSYLSVSTISNLART